VVGVSPHSLPQNEGTAQTAERLAEQYKVSRATIERDGHEFLAAAFV
jgi:predicted DNA-binding transcriptional regulator YafY